MTDNVDDNGDKKEFFERSQICRICGKSHSIADELCPHCGAVAITQDEYDAAILASTPQEDNSDPPDEPEHTPRTWMGWFIPLIIIGLFAGGIQGLSQNSIAMSLCLLLAATMLILIMWVYNSPQSFLDMGNIVSWFFLLGAPIGLSSVEDSMDPHWRLPALIITLIVILASAQNIVITRLFSWTNESERNQTN